MPPLVYLSGPYTAKAVPGIESVTCNVKRARGIAVELWDKGYYVLTPHMNTMYFEDACKSATYQHFMDGGLRMIEMCDAVLMLPHWGDSTGARIEREHAMKLGVPIYGYPNLPPLNLAERRVPLSQSTYHYSVSTAPGIPCPPMGINESLVTHGFRESVGVIEGPPSTDILKAAHELVHGDRQASYGAPLDDFTKTARLWSVILETNVSPEQVALCMVMVKVSRELNGHMIDNVIDAAGYLATLQMVIDERERRATNE